MSSLEHPAIGGAPSSLHALGLWLVLPLLASPEGALDAAITCYEGLYYISAEERLAEALAAGLAPADQFRARRHEALLALAFRDEARMRRAARAIYAIDPDWVASDLPPRLAAIFAEERPLPPPPPRPLVSVDLTSLRLTGDDQDRWSEGLGVQAAGGVLLQDRLALQVGVGYSDHRPRAFVDQGLDLLTLGAGAHWRQPVGPIRVQAGLAGGAARVAVDGALTDQAYWGGFLSVPIEVSWPIYADRGVGAGVGALVFLTGDGDRLASSLVVPLFVGLRYGP